MPSNDDGKDGNFEYLPSIKLVMDYSQMGYNDVMMLPTDLFQQMLKNQVIINYSKTEEGRQYLADCERMKKTTPDIDGIRRKLKRGE